MSKRWKPWMHIGSHVTQPCWVVRNEAELLQRISDGVWLWSEVISAFATLALKGGSFDRAPRNLASRLLPASWTLSVIGVSLSHTCPINLLSESLVNASLI